MKKYQIIYADPPWKHVSWPAGNRRPERHYPVMSLQEIMELPVKNLADDNCWLFLWTTGPHLMAANKVIESWGFAYRTIGFTWTKLNKTNDNLAFGCGSTTRANAEFCLLATKGRCRRVSADVLSAVITRRERHSKKPDEVRNRIIRLCGNLPRIELFARERHPGWDVFGNQVEGSINLSTYELRAA